MPEIRKISEEDLIEIKNYVKYDESSPSGLVWINGSAKRIGKPAGSVRSCRSNHYWELTINRRKYSCHRLVVALYDLESVNHLFIDHIDGNGLNNKKENLRCVNIKGNQRNRKLPNNNSSGVVGIHLLEIINGSKTKTNKYWEAGYHDADGRYIRKKFNCSTLGNEKALALAMEWRKMNIEKLNVILLNLNDYCYTDDHGVRT